jgi:hypothetical protein
LFKEAGIAVLIVVFGISLVRILLFASETSPIQTGLNKKGIYEPGVVVHTYNPSNGEAEAGG